MKKIATFPLTVLVSAFLLTQLAPITSYGQLVKGDLIFTYFNSKGSAGSGDIFAFILLKALPANSTVYFTDIGFGGTTFNTDNGGSESRISWASGAAILPVGAEIKIEGLVATNVRTALTVGTVTALSGTLGLSMAGLDQVFAYQGTLAVANVIAGIHWNNCSGNTNDANWDVSPCSTISGTSGSTLPTGLTSSNAAMWAGLTGGVARVAGSFNCTGVTTTDVSTLRTTILNRANWNFITIATDAFAAPAGCSYAVLPLKLISFTGKAVTGGVALQWVTAEEVNTAGFDIERRLNNGDFVVIGSVLANATNGQYQYMDDRAITGNTYAYRLTMRDIDGRFTYSPVVSVAYAGNRANRYSIYPVPATAGTLYIKPLSSDTETTIQITVTDLAGKTVYQNLSVGMRNGRFEIPVQGLARGPYLLRIADRKGGLLQVSTFRKS